MSIDHASTSDQELLALLRCGEPKALEVLADR